MEYFWNVLKLIGAAVVAILLLGIAAALLDGRWWIFPEIVGALPELIGLGAVGAGAAYLGWFFAGGFWDGRAQAGRGLADNPRGEVKMGLATFASLYPGTILTAVADDLGLAVSLWLVTIFVAVAGALALDRVARRNPESDHWLVRSRLTLQDAWASPGRRGGQLVGALAGIAVVTPVMMLLVAPV